MFSHRFHRSAQKFLLSVFSHRFHRFPQKLGCLQGGASVPSVGVTLLLRRQGYLRYYLPHPTNLCKSVQSVGGSPQQQVLWILCNLWEDCCFLSVFSHRFHRFTQKLGCFQGGASVPSVGVTLLLRRQGYLRYYLPHPTNLCKSVQSVGGSPQQQVLWILCNLWEALLSSRFCEFCAICGRIYAP